MNNDDRTARLAAKTRAKDHDWKGSKATRRLLDGRTIDETIKTQPISTRAPGKWALVDMETGDVWNGATMKQADYADLALALAIIKRRIDGARQLLDVDGLVLWAPPENHDAIRSFMKVVGGEEWVSCEEMGRWCSKLGFSSRRRSSLPPSMQLGMPVIEALEKLFHAEPANFDDKYNRPGARPE